MTEQHDTRYAALLRSMEALADDPVAAREMAAARFADRLLAALDSAMERGNIRASELARELGVTESAVSQVLKGDGNLRAFTFARYMRALGFEADVTIREAGARSSTSRKRSENRLIKDIEQLTSARPTSAKSHVSKSLFTLAGVDTATLGESSAHLGRTRMMQKVG